MEEKKFIAVLDRTSSGHILPSLVHLELVGGTWLAAELLEMLTSRLTDSQHSGMEFSLLKIFLC